MRQGIRTHSSDGDSAVRGLAVMSNCGTSKNSRLTRAERVVSTLELLAGGEVLALGSDALEVVGVVLEAARGQEPR